MGRRGVLAAVMMMVGCEGPIGPQGEMGAPGSEGSPGADGVNGVDGMPATLRAPMLCGMSVSLDGGEVGGLLAAADRCREACASDTAHMCTTHEAVLVLQDGQAVPTTSWVASGVWSGDGWPSDCGGWHSSDAERRASAIAASGLIPVACSDALPLACCD